MNNLAGETYLSVTYFDKRKQTSIGRFMLSKVLQAGIALLLFSFIVFNIFNPPQENHFYYGNEQTIAEIKQLEKEWHLTDPLPTRYGRWLVNMVKGDWGKSLLPPDYYK